MLRLRERSGRVTALLTIILILSSTILPSISLAKSTKEYTQTLKTGISSFPKDYQSDLKELQKMHPNWNFEAYYTGIDWDTFINSQTCATKTGISLISKSVEASWKDTCDYNVNNNNSFVCASRGITEYYADPRNFLDETSIFQFSEYTYNSKVHTLAGVKKSVKGTFLDDTVTFKLDGKDKEMSYAEIIMEAAKQSKMSPYSIRAKIIQEVGVNGSGSVSGKYKNYEGYYNFYNYGAYDDNKLGAIGCALKYAKEKGWDNQYTAIVEGAKLLSNSYTLAGQNTAYFYKWDVVGKSVLTTGKTQKVDESMLFTHQYMTNIQDPWGQSKSLWSMYNNAGILDEKINFIIPVYQNMPKSTSKPTSIDMEGKNLYYADVDTNLQIRSKPSTSGSVLCKVAKKTKVIMLEREYKKADDYSWDKIQLSNGTIGYAASMYLKPCENETKDVAVTSVKLDKSNVSLEVGNGAVITSTVLKANITPSNATNKTLTWSTSNSKVATVSSGTVKAVGEGSATITVKTKNGKTATCKVTVVNVEEEEYQNAVINADVLNVRKTPSTSAASIAKVYENEYVKVLEENAGKHDNYIWSKIQTTNGVVGYVAKEYLTILEDIKIDEENKQIIVTPDMLAKDINENNSNLVITDAKGKSVKANDLIGTGYKVKDKSTSKEYVIVKKGDTNGDGKVKATDYMCIKNYIMNTKKFKECEKAAADVNGDGKVKATDYMRIKNYIMEQSPITL